MDSSPATPLRHCCRKTSQRRLCALSCLLIATGGLFGCQGNQSAHRDLYYRELRLQEDEIYRLEDCIKEYQSIVRGYRIEIEDLKAQQPNSPAVSSPNGATLEQPSNREGSSLLDSLDSFGAEPPAADAGDNTPDISPPAIDLGVPTNEPPPLEPPGVAPPSSDSLLPLEPSPQFEPPESLPPPLGRTPWNEEAPRDVSTAQKPEPLGSATIEGFAGPIIETGEPTLVALIRAKTASGEPSSFCGKASLLLVDPSAEQSTQNLARWDFSREEVAESWRADTSDPVLDLAVVLPKGAPTDHQLRIWMRLEDDQGNRVVQKTDFVLGKLASIESVQLASQQEATGETPPGNWRRSNRTAPEHQNPALALTTPDADSGWTQAPTTSTPPVAGGLELVSHEEPLPATPKPAPAWSPKR